MTTPPETGVEASFQFAAAIQSLATEVRQQRERQQMLAQCIHPIPGVPPVQMTISAGAGSYYQPNLTGPQLGSYWDVKRISCTGYTAGTVTVYLNQVGGEILAIFSAAGVLFNGKAHIMLGGNDNMYFSATGITLAAGAGGITLSWSVIEVAAPAIGAYLQ